MRVVLSIICLVSFTTSYAQGDLKTKLQDKETFSEIMAVVRTHYAELAQQGLEQNPNDPKQKHWERWAWYMSGRLGPSGEFVNITALLNKAYPEIQQTRSTISDWSFIGPSQSTYGNMWGGLNGLARVDRIAFHPSNSSIIYVGTPAGGLWRTTNGGGSWTPLTDHIPSPGISGIVVSHANPNVIYILTGDGDANLTGGFVKDFGYLRRSIGVLKSTDGGLSWHQTGVLSSNTFYGYRLVQDPNDANVLLAATNVGVYRTSNGGASWALVRGGKHYDVAFKPGSSTTVYASGLGQVVYSTNSGLAGSWQVSTLDFAIDGGGRVELATTPANPDLVYMLAGPRVDSITFNGIFLSTNSGANFTRMVNTPNILSGASDGNGDNDQADYDLGICASPTNQNLIITAGIILWKSTTAGLTVSNLTTYVEDPSESWYVHPDMHDVAFNPLDGKLYAAGDGGIYVSSDAGENWTDISTGIAATQVYHMAGTVDAFDKVLIGNQDNGVKLRTANSTDIPHIDSGDGFDGAFAAGTPSTFYASINTGVSRYTNDGLDVRVPVSPSTLTWFKPLATHVSNPNIVFVGSADTIFRSDNQGAAWDTLTGASGTWSLATCPSNANRIYSAGGDWFGETAGEVYRSDDLGDTWATISSNTGFPSSYTKVTDVAVHPGNSGIVWVTIGGFTNGSKVYRSGDAGLNWQNMTGSVPNIPVNCIAIDTDGSAYVGTDLGVFFKRPAMNDWIPYSNHLPVVPVTDIVIYNSVLRASTFGRGVWQSPKPTTCSIASNITNDLIGDLYYEASLSIISTSEVQGGMNTRVAFKAGNYVQLDPGFEVKAANTFQAYIGDCASGGIPID